MLTMHHGMNHAAIAERAIKERVAELGGEIAAVYAPCLDAMSVITVLADPLILLSGLIRMLPIRIGLGPVAVLSYAERTTSSHGAQLEPATLPDVHNRNVLIVDDIVETGRMLRKHE